MAPLGSRLGNVFVEWWRTRMAKLTVVFLAVAVWVPWLVAIPGAYYALRLVRLGTRRLLYSVRAKLAAFYLYAALLPILLVATVLCFVGYVVLGQVSARVIERRLEEHLAWMEQRARRAEESFWAARLAGLDARASARKALEDAYGDVDRPGFACWATSGAQGFTETRGAARPARTPAWLGARRFVGLALADTARLELRARVPVPDAEGFVEIVSLLPVTTPVLNARPEAAASDVRGGPGAPGRDLQPQALAPDSLVLREGIFAYLNPSARVSVRGSGVRVQHRGGALAPQDTVAAPAAQAVPGIRTRYGLLDWLYIAYPVDWHTGRTQAPGPPILVKFSPEGASRALLRTGVGIDTPIVVGVAVVVGFLVLLQLVATLQGFAHARAIAGAVGKLDRGVRAVRSGDFGYRIRSPQRDQLGMLAHAFDDMAQRLQDLLEERAEREVMERELSIARDVQSRLFPERTPQASFLEASGLCLPAHTVSGDYYDFVDVPGGYDAIVADVSGKGMSAALLMASLHSALRSQYLQEGGDAGPDPGQMVTRLNRHLHRYVEPARFVTLFLARYRGQGQLSYCNAGHNPAALVRDGRVDWLGAGGTVLGPFADLKYETARVPVVAGDILCMYTDGVTEAPSPSGEHYGEQRLGRILAQEARRPVREILACIHDDVRKWRGEAEAADDVTIVVVRITA